MTARRVAIVGAGVAGIACASRLQAVGMQVQLFDQAAQPGGRCASLRTAAGTFDHGAASFAANGDAFARQVRDWAAAGSLEADPQVANAWMGRPTMSDWVSHCAMKLHIASGHEVAAIEPAGEGRWRLRFHCGLADAGPFDAVLVATPPESAAVLLQADTTLAASLRSVRSEPCWSVVAAWSAPLGLDESAIRGGPLLHQVRREENKPGRVRAAACATRWVLHATSYWSANNLDVQPEQVTRHLLEAFGKAAGRRLARPTIAAAHLWRQARVLEPLSDACGWSVTLQLGACGDAWFGEAGAAGVERAWSSGCALAARVLDAT